MPVGVTTGAWIEPDLSRRLALVRSWHAPDYTSVNLSEPGALAMMETLLEIGVGIEAGVWTVEDAELLGASGMGERVTRILVEPGELQVGDSAADALRLVEDIHRTLDRVRLTIPRLQHGDGRVTWVILADAVRRGIDTRIGLEDTVYEPNGERTTGNVALVRAARALGAGPADEEIRDTKERRNLMTITDVQTAVQTLLDDLISSGVERGLQAAAYLNGECVVDAWAGIADAGSGQPVNGDTLFTVFSSTKGVTSTVMHLLAERGVLDYDAPIATYWPAFAANGKEGITVRHALTHAAGIPQRPTGVPPTDWDGMCREIAALTPLWEPGTQHGYHAGTFGWILGETARRVDGRPIQQIVREDICRPIGIEDSLFFGIPDAVEPRVATLENDASITNAPAAPPDSLIGRAMPNSKEYYALYNRPEMRRAVQPAGGGIMSARALARHYAALVGNGVDGVRLLTPERVQTATALQTDAKDVVIGLPMRRGLGYMLGGPVSPMSARITAFGHAGYGGSIGFADPDHRFAFALTKNRLAFSLPEQSTVNKVASAVRAALGIPER